MIEVKIPESCVISVLELLARKLEDRDTAIKKMEKAKSDIEYKVNELEIKVKELKSENRMMHETYDEKF